MCAARFGKGSWCFLAGFTCHDHGATVLQYAPKHQLLISGGRKGWVCLFDIRQRQLMHTFHAHDSAIKALALDPCEEYFTTGSAEGNIKVSLNKSWSVLSFFCQHDQSPNQNQKNPHWNVRTHRGRFSQRNIIRKTVHPLRETDYIPKHVPELLKPMHLSVHRKLSHHVNERFDASAINK